MPSMNGVSDQSFSGKRWRILPQRVPLPGKKEESEKELLKELLGTKKAFIGYGWTKTRTLLHPKAQENRFE